METEILYTVIRIIDSKVITVMNVIQRGKFIFLTDLTGIRIAGMIRGNSEEIFLIKNNERKPARPVINYGIFR